MLRTGFISAALQSKTYVYIAVVGLALGLGLSSIGVIKNVSNQFSFVYSGSIGTLYNYIGSLATSVAYIALVMLLVKSKAFQIIKVLLMNVGKMALSNYIMQSVIATFIFYGFGLGYFGDLSRVSLIYIVLPVSYTHLTLPTIYSV